MTSPVSAIAIPSSLSPSRGIATTNATAATSPTSPGIDPFAGKQLLNVVVIGTEHAGKSTATGHLVFKCGAVDPQILAHFEARAAAAVHSTTLASATAAMALSDSLTPIGPHTTAIPGSALLPPPGTPPSEWASPLATSMASSPPPPSFHFSWLTDQLQAARDAGLPLDMHPDAARFATSKYAVQVIDVPGHRDFVKNMVTGASRADLAILVVSAVEHEFAHGMGTTTTSSATAPSSQSSALTGGGETVEHAMLAHTLGVRQIIVAVNKMDAVGYSHDRYASVVAETSAMLKRLGYNPKTVSYVPISGRTGDGLVEASADPRMAWFTGWRKDGKAGEKTGSTLVQAIDAIDPPRKLSERPLRVAIQDVYKIASVGVMPVGRVEAGILRIGQHVRFAPGGAVATVMSVETQLAPSQQQHQHQSSAATPLATALSRAAPDNTPVSHIATASPIGGGGGALAAATARSGILAPHTPSAPATRAPGEAYPGDHVAFAVSGAALRDLRRGQVCSEHVPDGQTVPVPSSGPTGAPVVADVAAEACEVVAFTAHVVVFLDHTVTAVVPGYTPVCDAHTAHVPVRVDALVAKLDRRSGQVVEDKPKQLRPGDAAVVRLVPTKPMCVEPYAEFPALGRFALRDQRHTVMVGVVKSVEKKLDDGRIVVWPPPRGSGAKKV